MDLARAFPLPRFRFQPRLSASVRRLTLKCGTLACLSSYRNTPHMHFLSREDNAKWGRIIKEAGIKGD